MDGSVRNSVTALVPGTCGELVQGMVEGQDFLVTCPIDRWSAARVAVGAEVERWEANRLEALQAVTLPPERELSVQFEDGRFTGSPQTGFEKTLAVLRLLGFAPQGLPASLSLRLQSWLRTGRGMASSTADLVAAAAVVQKLLDKAATPRELAELALQVEPSDGVMYPGIALFDHLSGEVQESLGPAPGLEVLVLDAGESIDTRDFNQREDLEQANKEKEPAVREALELVKAGVAEQDPQLVGEGATLSARANQECFAKPLFQRAEELAPKVGAVGINVAHSGTVVGLLFDAAQQSSGELLPVVAQRLPGVSLEACRVVNGGVRFSEVKVEGDVK